MTIATAPMIDAIHDDIGGIPASAVKVAGYNTGTSDIQWTAADWARFPHAGHVILNQGFTWTAPEILACHGVDVEAQAVTAQHAADAARMRVAAGVTWTTVYGTAATLAAVVGELEAAGPKGWFDGHVDAWLSDWNLTEAQAAALIGTEIHGLTCRAVQWASPTSNPGTLVPGTSTLTLKEANVDLSVTAADWHAAVAPSPAPKPAPVPAGPTKAQAAAALATLTDYLTTH